MKPKLHLFSKKVPKGKYIEWNNSKDFTDDEIPIKLVIFTHGWLDGINKQDSKVWMKPARLHLLNKTEPWTVVLYDWR